MLVDVADFVTAPRILSLAIREFRRIPRADLDRMAFIDRLRRFIREGGHDMVIPTDDQTLAALTEHYDDFKDMVHIACPPPSITRLVLNKAATLEIARKLGIPVPKTAVVSSSAQLSELVGSFPFPWVLKPAEKETRLEETKSFAFSNIGEVVRMFPQPREFTPPMLLQEYCVGAGVGVEMLMHQGNCLGVFQHCRLKELPYTGGYSVTAIAEQPDPALVGPSLALLRALQWEGIAMVEFKVNPDGGRAVLMEVNGRYWGTISLPILAGMDFPLYHWQVVHGERPDIPSTYAAGTKWRWTTGYFARLYSLLGAARSSAHARKVLSDSLRQLPGDFGPRVFDATLRLTDPLPSVAIFFRAMKYFVFHSVGALMKTDASGQRHEHAAISFTGSGKRQNQ